MTVDGVIYVIGGSDVAGAPKPVLVYDPARDNWTVKKALSNVTACWGAHVIGGRIFALGVKREANPAIRPFRTDEYDTAADAISERKPLPSSRGGHASAAVNGRIYVFGGAAGKGKHSADVEAYDTKTDTWTKLPDMSVGRSWMGAVTLNNSIYLLGGVSTAWETPDKTLAVFTPGM